MVFCRPFKIALLVALVPPAGPPISSLPPVQQVSQLGRTGSQNPSAAQLGSNAGGLFSGMQMGSSLAPTYQVL